MGAIAGDSNAQGTGGGTPPSRRLAAIMFTDLVGYSALANRDEALAIELLELHRTWIREILPQHGGVEIETVGDAFLIEFAGARAAVECAAAIHQRFTEHNASAPENLRLELRIGIHLGDIEHKDGKVMGDVVNIASRIHGMAPPGGICVSEDVHRGVRTQRGFRFQSLGTPALKNIATPVALYRVLWDGAPAARTPWLQPASHRWLWAVAVLPFTSISGDQENAYFSDGMHDTILTHLTRVKALKVISRTSVMQFRDGDRNIAEIAQALGVDHVVEGSVQKAGNRVRVQAQLIEAATDRHLWADSYDRDVADVFAIQSEIAQHIVTAIQATLTPQEKARIEQRPTVSPEAYDLYLRGAAFACGISSAPSRELLFRSQTLLERVIDLDPSFALAHAALAATHIRMFFWGFDATARRRDQAKAAADTALRLEPDLAEGHSAMGQYFYSGFRDYERALEELGEALARAPNAVDTHAFIAFVQRRQGSWDSASASLNRAAELDPRSAHAAITQGLTYWMAREYARALPYFERAQALAPDGLLERLWLAHFQLLWKGDPEPVKRALERVPPGVDPGQTATAFKVVLATHEGRYEEAIALIPTSPREDFALLGGSNFEVPKDLSLGQLHTMLGNAELARAHFVRARARLQSDITREPDGIFLAHAHASLGLVQAYLGEHGEALRNADRAVQLLPISRDAVDGPWIAQIAAATQLRLGDQGRALAELGRILGKPCGPEAHLLRRDPDWQPLWGDPRFQKLIAEHLPEDAGA